MLLWIIFQEIITDLYLQLEDVKTSHHALYAMHQVLLFLMLHIPGLMSLPEQERNQSVQNKVIKVQTVLTNGENKNINPFTKEKHML